MRFNLTTGQKLGRSDGVIGANINHAVWKHRAWWIIHDGLFFNGKTWSRKKEDLLTKLDEEMRPVAETSLPSCPQTLFFSPDRRYAYQFICKRKIAEDLSPCGKMEVKRQGAERSCEKKSEYCGV